MAVPNLEIDAAFHDAFQATLIHAAQQMDRRVIDAMDLETGKRGERWFFDRIGAVDMEEKLTRHADTPVQDPKYDKRVIVPRTYHKAVPVDNDDAVRRLLDPKNDLVMTLAAGLNRQLTQTALDAINGSSVVGRAADSSVALPAAQKIAAGGAKLTTEKLQQARQLLIDSELQLSDGEVFNCAVNALQLRYLQQETTNKSISGDFGRMFPLEDGQLPNWVGFRFHRVKTLPASGTDDLVLCWISRAMKAGIGGNIVTRIGERSDKSYMWQAYTEVTVGATRLHEEGVVEIACNQS